MVNGKSVVLVIGISQLKSVCSTAVPKFSESAETHSEGDVERGMHQKNTQLAVEASITMHSDKHHILRAESCETDRPRNMRPLQCYAMVNQITLAAMH